MSQQGPAPERLGRKTLLYIGMSIVAPAAVYVILVATGVVPWPYACSTETALQVKGLSGADFEVTDTTCDTFAKEEFVNVYVSSTRANEAAWITRLLKRRTLLFRYVPQSPDDPLPSITSSGPKKVLISIATVSSIISQSNRWGDISVDYQISHIQYP